MIRKALVAAALFVSAPAAAYTLTGTISGDGGSFFRPLLPFDRDGTASIVVTLSGTAPFGVDTNSTILRLDLFFYDFYDPQTGESQGGDDNFGSDQPVAQFGDDNIKTMPPYFFRYVLDPAGPVNRRHDYVVQNPGDPYPSEIGYYQTLLTVVGNVFGGSGPVDYTITVDGSAVVPEPATWALMIAGFGAAGLGLRRRRAISF